MQVRLGDILEQVEDAAKAWGVTPAEFVRLAVITALEVQTGPQDDPDPATKRDTLVG